MQREQTPDVARCRATLHADAAESRATPLYINAPESNTNLPKTMPTDAARAAQNGPNAESLRAVTNKEATAIDNTVAVIGNKYVAVNRR